MFVSVFMGSGTCFFTKKKKERKKMEEERLVAFSVLVLGLQPA